MEIIIMLKTIRGHYKNGDIKLYEKPQLEEGEIIVTFLNSEGSTMMDLGARGISMDDALELKNRLKTFEDDWNAEGMELYDAV
jgi:predicted DNA-binding antitoxin AbrB/MazE fold protein